MKLSLIFIHKSLNISILCKYKLQLFYNPIKVVFVKLILKRAKFRYIYGLFLLK